MPVVGFENHAGRTYLGASCTPFGSVIGGHGWGNNDADKADGALFRNVVGSYLHGPLLAKNPDDAALKDRFAKTREAFDEKTLALIKHKLAVNPTATATRYEYGVYLVQHGKFAEAIAELQTAQQDESIKSDCALAIAFCFEKLKKHKLAMTNYETAIRLLGNKVNEPLKRALYGAARLSAVLGDFKTAEQYATRLAGIDFSYKDIAQLLDKITERLQN